MKYKSSSIKSKWLKTKWLLKQPDLRKYVPTTMQFNRANLQAMLSKNSTTYFKPTGGSGGFNIIRITTESKGYKTKLGAVKSYFSNSDQLYHYLNRFSKKRSYLLQKGIHLATTHGDPFDIRVMVQKTNEGKWVSTALFTKIGKPGKVATNYNQGGKVGFFHPTMSGTKYSTASIQRIEAQLKHLGVSVGKNFDRHINGFRELGLDVALDSRGNAWILEVNTRPQFYPLKKMRDQKLYRKIVSYARQYGRTK
ncbi:YheC/YheD family protein [Cohnella sp. WQ 127256]|uniref:YheC/YheD family protein n=1 Tax=Cohnella sp. WQ 127256 TaxID=2938790 RepID=UPI00211887BB|nr:YheC/YheD family protein [Cohnella sp. WQ 127256]